MGTVSYRHLDFYIANIIARHLSGEITPEESVQLESWRKEEMCIRDRPFLIAIAAPTT